MFNHLRECIPLLINLEIIVYALRCYVRLNDNVNLGLQS